MLRFFTTLSLFLLFLLVLNLTSCKEDAVQPELFGALSGQVKDVDTNAPIEGAGITTSPPSSAIVTDNNGMFTLSDLPVGNYTISATKTGYKKGSVSVAVREDMTTAANIFLEKDSGLNSPPNLPWNPTPANNTMDQNTSLTLSWSASDPDAGDSLTFNIYLYESNSPTQILLAADYPDTSILAENLNFNTTYFWQVVVKDDNGKSSNGDVWSFATRALPDNPIVFASTQEGDYEIYSTGIIDTSFLNTFRLTNHSSRDWWPRLSPARDKIAFTSDRDVEPQIYTMNRDGSDIFKVTSLPVAGFHNYGIGFCWSPDGTRFLYSHYEKLYRVDSDRGNLVQIATAPSNRHFREVDWSPTGDKIVALTIGSQVYDSEIYLMNSDGSNMTLFVDNLPGMVESPSFSPDGNSIMFTHDVSGFQSQTGRQLDAHIFIWQISGSDSTDVSIGKIAGTNDTHPRFSPDGAKVIFTNAPNDGSAPKEIWIMGVDGSNRKKFIEGEMPDWR